MCGRYSMHLSLTQLQDEFQKMDLPVIETRNSTDYNPSNNIGPTKTAPVYFNDRESDESNTTPVIQFMTWGLIPVWIDTTEEIKKQKYTTFNARAETISNSRLWSKVRDRRCVIPVEGYFEWQSKLDPRTGKTIKVPNFIKRKDGNLLFLAGFWNMTKVRDLGEDETEETKQDDNKIKDVYSFTVITGMATNELESIHNRIPIIFEPGTKQWDTWLGSVPWDDHDFLESLKACDNGVLEWYEVSKDVGNVKNDGDYLTKPVGKKEGALDNFFGNSKSKAKVEKESNEAIEVKDESESDDTKTDHKFSPVKHRPSNSPQTPSPRKRRNIDKNQPSIFDHLNKKSK